VNSPRKRLRVGVLYGGRSGEHEVSLASAAAVFANLDRGRYEPIAIRIEKDGRWVLADRPPTAASAAEVIEQARAEGARSRGGREVFLLPRPGDATLLAIDRRGRADADGAPATITELHLDVIFPVLHGPFGEDGTIQGLLELANVPYVGAGVLASSVAMDKVASKVVFAARSLPICDYELVLGRDWQADAGAVAKRLADRLGFPLFVKPANLGSSVGISKVKAPDALAPAMNAAFEFDRRVIVEAAVGDAREIEVAVLGNDSPDASVAGEIVPSREFYDYEAKYLDEGSRTIIPADLEERDAQAIRRMAIDAFRALDCSGMARVDFLVSRRDGRIYINEANTIPGFTTISMYSKMWEASGVPYPSLLDRLISLAVERHAERQQLRTSI
jgi:D-alanine-D-alanine ligase